MRPAASLVDVPVLRWLHTPLLFTQGAWTAWRAVRLPPASGPREGLAAVPAGARSVADPQERPEQSTLQLLAIGDSIIAGVGVESTGQALPSRLAKALAARRGAPVYWAAHGRNGARSAWLQNAATEAACRVPAPDLVLVSIGINDVTTTRGESDVFARLVSAIEGLERRFPDAVIAQLALPPLGVFPALPRPLRTVLGRRSDRIDRSLREWLQPRPRSHWLAFEALPEPAQFARDGYHPAPPAVADWAASLGDQLLAIRPDWSCRGGAGDAGRFAAPAGAADQRHAGRSEDRCISG